MKVTDSSDRKMTAPNEKNLARARVECGALHAIRNDLLQIFHHMHLRNSESPSTSNSQCAVFGLHSRKTFSRSVGVYQYIFIEFKVFRM